ncbi:MFS transporter [Geitlerinema sp. PCC 9228]|jgi:MFS family permease|uniref:MFS transporter n=1 Tax=Geitlerinema sp. PCC 9228 TaxID=111611 RepID=UPI000B303013|nr:MFS transporter [Geitlerinema sp. PCC 9228]
MPHFLATAKGYRPNHRSKFSSILPKPPLAKAIAAISTGDRDPSRLSLLKNLNTVEKRIAIAPLADHLPTAPMSEPLINSWKVKATLLLTSTTIIFPSAAIAPALPAMQDYFAEVKNVEYWVRLVLTMPAISIIAGGLLSGQLIDRIGRKPLLVATTIIAGLAGGAGFVLDDIWTLLASRVVLGFAIACSITSVTTLIADYYQDRTRSNLMGWQSTTIGTTGVFLLAISGFLADIGWRLPFLLYLVPVLLVPFMILWLYEPSTQQPKEGEPHARRASQQPSPWPIRILAIIYGVEMLHMFLYYLTPVQMPFYLREGFDLPASRSGIAIATMTLSQAAISLVYGKIRIRLGFANILTVAFAVGAVGHAIVAFAPNYWMIISGLSISGLGFGMLFPNSKVWLSETVPADIRGRALGGLTTAFYIGEFLSPFASQTAVKWVGGSGTYALASGILLLISAIALATRSQMVEKPVATAANPSK